LETLAASDARIRVIRNDVNRGLAASLNVAWSQASGDLFARMDADDISYPDRLHRQVEFMAAHPEVAVMGTGIELMSSEGRFLGFALRPEWHEELQKKMYKENPFAHPSVIMRRSFLEGQGGYDERLRWAEDSDLWLRGYRQFKYHNLQVPLIRYHVRKRIPLRNRAYSALVLLRAALRERLFLTHGWYALRPLVAGALVNLRLRSLYKNLRNDGSEIGRPIR
jgi:glycosyltransferase involved in cell wall biosynthesis